MNTATSTTGRAAGTEAQLQLVRLSNGIYQLRIERDGMYIDQENCSVFSSSTSAPPTTPESIGASTPRALSPTLFIDDHDDELVPVVDIYNGGDMVLNVRRLCFGEDGEAPSFGYGPLDTGNMYTKGKPLARFRVSSTVLQLASQHVKDCLDSKVGRPTGLLKKASPLPTGLSVPWMHKDDKQNLNLLMQSIPTMSTYSVLEDSSAMSHEGKKAFATLLRILHFTFDSTDCIETEIFNAGVMAALVADLACAFGCVDPVVPWINLWLTKDLTWVDTSDWYCSAKGHYLGIVIGYAVGDRSAFSRWSRLCIRYGCDSNSFTGLGYVWSIINDDLQKKRQQYVQELWSVLDYTWNRYNADLSDATKVLTHSVALGAFAGAVHRYLGHHPPFVNIPWEGSLDDLMLVFGDIKKQMDTVWKALATQCGCCKTISFSLQNPADLFWENAATVWAEVSGLDLEDYRPEVEELLDVYGLIDCSIPKEDASYYVD
ncbi:hypothetical protein EV426DRAFT_610217 [Tirmania nivea]|nr:hypothetical protein EV426DRAFT_610217 [Tirmania nivea]